MVIVSAIVWIGQAFRSGIQHRGELVLGKPGQAQIQLERVHPYVALRNVRFSTLRALCEAICAREPDAAKSAMQGHIDFVRSRVMQGVI